MAVTITLLGLSGDSRPNSRRGFSAQGGALWRAIVLGHGEPADLAKANIDDCLDWMVTRVEAALGDSLDGTIRYRVASNWQVAVCRRDDGSRPAKRGLFR